MSQEVGKNNDRVYRLVLTGGPCGGKTTGQARLCTFFENLGWKVYRVPETATVLIGGGVKWTDLTDEQVFQFQANLMKTMMQIEDTFFDLAASTKQNCLVICDRGTMDATAYLKAGQWERMREEYGWNSVELRDGRYNQVIHMVSAAKGAEPFYCTELHATRYEDLDLARKLDDFASQAWVGHPYFDVIDNTTDFEHKINRMITAVCNRLGLEAGDRLSTDSRKRKFLVKNLPRDLEFPQFQDFIVVHNYLVTPNSKMQARIRRRGQNVKWDDMKECWNLETGPQSVSLTTGPQKYQVSSVYIGENCHPGQIYIFGTDLDFSNWTYTHTIRRPEINKESPERKMQISIKEYELLLQQKDFKHYTIYKKRRCFLWNDQYFQMDIYQEPCHLRCKGLIMLETYTTLKGDDLSLPSFLQIVKEVTQNGSYSMYNLSKRDPEDNAVPVAPGKLAALMSNKLTVNGHVEDDHKSNQHVTGSHAHTNGMI